LNIATNFVVDAAWSERQFDERRLKQFTDEHRFLVVVVVVVVVVVGPSIVVEQFTDELLFVVVEPDTIVAVCALLRALGELLEAEAGVFLQSVCAFLHRTLGEFTGAIAGVFLFKKSPCFSS